MSSKSRVGRKTQKSGQLEVNTEAVRILRALNEGEAFYFYEDLGKPTGDSARSLYDFLQKINSVKLESLQFHVKRKDFERWISETLGDSKLAKKVGRIRASNSDDLRRRICSSIEDRLEELRGASLTFLVDQGLTVTTASSMR